MNLLDRIKELAHKRGISITQLEEELDIPKNTIYQWKNRIPSPKRLQLVADYFNVTTDYLLGRNKTPYWADENDLVELDKLLESNVNMAYGGETLTPEQIQRVKDILTATFWDIVKEDKEKGKKKWLLMEMDTINLVEDLKRKYQSANPFYICEKMGITIKYVPFINNPKGQFQEIRDHAIIFLSDELKESEERFYICAHELGHAIFHRGLSSYYVSTRISRSKSESEANCFAANLIVSLYKEDNDRYPRQVEELKSSYGLPESAYRFLV